MGESEGTDVNVRLIEELFDLLGQAMAIAHDEERFVLRDDSDRSFARHAMRFIDQALMLIAQAHNAVESALREARDVNRTGTE